MKLCDICQINPAAFHVAHIAGGKMSKQNLCKACAQKSQDGLDGVAQSFLAHLQGSEDAINFDEIDADAIEQIFSKSLDLPPDEMAELMSEVQSMLGEAMSDGDPFELEDDVIGDAVEFEDSQIAFLEDTFFDDDAGDGDEDDAEHSDDQFSEDAFSPLNDEMPPGVLPASGPLELHSARCAKCGTTWDRLREDGRAGCAYCYEAFEEKLREVMSRMQREAHHVGKTPRAALRRRRRLEQLREQRDHRLEMLQRRLQEAVAEENYEDAAALRDKIKMVSSTIVNDE